jgi:tetratricopeptide (TPR) repeat protein
VFRWLSLLAAGLAFGQSPVEVAFDHFYNLEFDQAVTLFSSLVRKDPGNADFHNHLAQAILYREMLRAGALESELVTGGNAFLRREKMNPSPEDQRRFLTAVDAAVRISKEALSRNEANADAHYTLGVAHALRSNYNFLVRKAWIDSLRDATAAREAHQRVLKLDPARVDARLIEGVHDYSISYLPWHYRLLGFLAGFRGDREGGIRTVQLVAREGVRNKVDAQILLAVIYRREQRFQDAVDLLRELIPRYPRNYLFRWELAQMYSDLGDETAALEAVAQVERLKRQGSPGFAGVLPEKILYFRATILFWYRHWAESAAAFQVVTARAAELDPHTGVTAWMRLGQSLDMLGRRKEALAAYRAAIRYAPDSAPAKESEGYLRRVYVRPPD